MSLKKRSLQMAMITTALYSASVFYSQKFGLVGTDIFFTNVVFADEVEKGDQQYTCPMHPHYISDDPGACPICGMDLVPMANTDSPESTSNETSDRTGINVAPEMIQSMGIRTGRVEETVFGRKLRAFGQVVENQRLRSSVSSRVNGWITYLAKNATGDDVKVGDHLYSLYSPDLFAAQQDYINALASGSNQRTKAAMRRLLLMNVSKTILAKIEKTRTALEEVPFYSEVSGTVSDLAIVQGDFVSPSTQILTVQSYQSVWIETSIAEKDLAAFKNDQQALLSTPSLPDWQDVAEVSYIYPTIDRTTRTGKIRLDVANEDEILKPGAFLDVTFNLDQRKLLAVPSEAVLQSSEGAHVVAVEGKGFFRPVSVKTGITTEGYTQIVSGLEHGQEIVTSGQFLLSSESSLRESFSKLQKARTPLSQIDLPDGDLLMMDHLLDAALYVHEAVIDGYDITPEYLTGATDAAEYLADKYRNTKLEPLVSKAGQKVEGIKTARTQTELLNQLSELVRTLQEWVLTAKADRYQSKDVTIFEDSETQREWLQIGNRPFNPYSDAHATALPFRSKKENLKMQDSAATMDGGANDHANH